MPRHSSSTSRGLIFAAQRIEPSSSRSGPMWSRRCGSTLLSDALFSGWGIRTLAHGESRYNPMSYHNGSVWPHDNALAAAGLARYGLRDEALRVLNAFFDVSKAVDLNRLPELF